MGRQTLLTGMAVGGRQLIHDTTSKQAIR